MIYRFEPLLKQTLWGGDRIIPFKHLDMKMENVGESWEISGVKDNETVVSEGPDKGKSLNTLLAEQREKLVGAENYRTYGDVFPLLIKFIDARQDLSIQVHPNDEIAHRHGKPRGKTEMWYSLTPGPSLYCGLKQKITPEEYARMVDDDTITDALARYDVSEGDVFFIPAGRIHAIGAGCFVAEIQQTSDVTYRIYDFKRRDKNGNLRELHTALAAESIDYTVADDYRTHYDAKKDRPVEVVRCPYFTTSVYDLTERMTVDYSELDSFVIIICVGGEGTLTTDDGASTAIHAGETVLMPATTLKLTIEGTVKFLETY